MGNSDRIGIRLLLDADSILGHSDKTCCYFVVRDCKNPKAREKSNLGPRRALRRLYSHLE